MRAPLVLMLALVIPALARAGIEYPAPDCNEQTPTGCVARLISNDLKQHVAQARMKALESGGTTLCIPPRYFELWNEQARREGEEHCELAAGALDAVGRFFACSVEGQGSRCARPNIGVALEGGGSKSAPFSLGVLAGLQRSRVLSHASVIGSASGGTYAAYFYYARILDRAFDPDFANAKDDDWFRDCFPSMYGPVMPDAIHNAGKIRWCKEAHGGEYVPLVPGNAFHAQVPHQYQAKVGQDLLSPFQTLRGRGTNWYDVDWLAAGGLVSVFLVAQAITMPPHWILHGLFDTHGNFAPTREAYRSGIERAYGHSTASWNRAIRYDNVLDPVTIPDELKTGTRFRRSWTLEDLVDSYSRVRASCAPGKNCGFPLWILSTSSSPGRSPTFWIAPQPRDFQRFSYELGPHGQGSGLLGFLDAPPPRLALRDAVGISAAFLDDQQRAVMANWWLQFFASAGVFIANLEWGTNVENFNVDSGARLTYQMMPWPIYWLARFQGLEAPYVRLSDGGNVDNLGLAALLRRGVRNIVVSASTDDLEGAFPSLCKLKNELELEIPRGQPQSVYKLHVPALEHFDRVCMRSIDRQEVSVWGEEAVRALFCERWNQVPGSVECDKLWDKRDKITPRGYDLFSWSHPVVEGCVVRRAPGDEASRNPCADARAEEREISRLLVIKPAIWHQAIGLQLANDEIKSCHWGNDDVTIGAPPSTAIPPGMNLPCVTLAFLRNNRRDYPDCRRGGAAFPQDDFIKMTLNSSYTLYGAYYDLGRHVAGHILPDATGTSLHVRHASDALIPACP